MDTTAAITTRMLTKHYRSVVAVDALDLTVRTGEVYGFIGRNGAGKTTTIRMLLGLVTPTDGEIEIQGERLTAGTWRWLKEVGSLVEAPAAYPNLTVAENLDLHRRLTRTPRARVPELIEQLQLGPAAHRRYAELSLGNRQRVGIAQALLRSPSILVLDEPANGLDPAGIIELRELLRSLAGAAGVTVFLSSHLLPEVAQLADRVGIIHDGRLVEELSRDELIARARAHSAATLTDQERADALLGVELERYFVDRTRTREA
jgi:ABC-2 type transport system ATP-binding protein